MKPNFALDLSFDGITLLHRAGEAGWHVVGEVALESATLGDDLAALRRKANTLDPSGLRTKLVIPDGQIRYLDIPEASAPHGDQHAAAENALDGATPYALDELAFDWTVSGDRVHIAAVARETLDEAESFAREHGFNPICFVADPDQSRYPGEPFFGMPGEAAAAESIARDSGPMKRLGTAPDAGPDAADPVAGDADPAVETAPPFSSVRAGRGLPPAPAPPLAGVARITPGPLPDTEARAISGAAQASLAPHKDAAGEGPMPAGAAVPGATATIPPDTRRGRTSPDAAALPPVAAAGSVAGGEEAEASDARAPTAADEAERMTIFGARSTQDARRGKPRFLGLFLTAMLLVVMIGVAALAAIFPDSGLIRLLRGSEPQIAVTPDIPELASTAPERRDDPAAPPVADTGLAPPETAPDGNAPDSAALPAPENRSPAVNAPAAGETGPEAPETTWPRPRTPEEARARRAASGISPTAPDAPNAPRSGSLDTFYQTSIDTEPALGDAIALPPAGSLRADPPPPRPAPPPPPGRTFDLDPRGLVRATPEGALTPDGVRVQAGPPPVRPPETPPRVVPVPGLDPTGAAAQARETMSGIRPRSRPETLLEDHERGALGGRTLTELATLRPRSRPVEAAAASAETGPDRSEPAAIAAAVNRAMEQAVPESRKPRLRPASVSRAAARTGQSAVAAPAPQIPTSASVARSATERNAINMRQVNLIGVYGPPSNRRALVRLSNGRYRKVQIGDRIDGGRVSAIGDSQLRYTKRGRNVVLRMPRG